MSTVHKSYHDNVDPIAAYCTNLSIRQHPLQERIQQETLAKAPMSMMLGAPEVLTFGQHFIQLVNGKRVLDIGTYTGASALAWAVAMPEDGEVFTFDVSHENYRTYGVPVISSDEKVFKKIHAIEAPALEELDKLIAKGEAGKFDFAFIDADKENYSNYYDRCMTLLKKGGVIMVDNALWSGRVLKPETTSDHAIAAANKKISEDSRSNSFLMNVGDGLHVAFKK